MLKRLKGERFYYDCPGFKAIVELRKDINDEEDKFNLVSTKYRYLEDKSCYLDEDKGCYLDNEYRIGGWCIFRFYNGDMKKLSGQEAPEEI